MYTELGFRGNGIGTQILRMAIKWAQRNEYSRIVLHASKAGRPLYLRHGFERSWEMRLDLS
jgi:GNAT superfamily N-acetyltransferase